MFHVFKFLCFAGFCKGSMGRSLLRGVLRPAWRRAGAPVHFADLSGPDAGRVAGQLSSYALDQPHPAIMHTPDIVILEQEPLAPEVLRALLDRFFEDMVKYVVDIEREVAAVGGQLHADGEALLLEQGSRQEDLWGANYYPGLGSDDCIAYTSLINIRPSQGNRSMEIEDEALRTRVRDVTFQLIGRGEPLP